MEPMIPRYLMVSGSIPIFTGVLIYLINAHFSEGNGIVIGVLCVIGLIFNIVWRICGEFYTDTV